MCRNSNEDTEMQVLAATDPASPWGNVLPWPELPDSEQVMRPQRVAGALVFSADGQLVAWLNRNRDRLLLFTRNDELRIIEMLALALSREAAKAPMQLSTFNGPDVTVAALEAELLKHGFVSTARGLIRRPYAPIGPGS